MTQSHVPLSPNDVLSETEARRRRCQQLGDYVYSVLPRLDAINAITTRGRPVFRKLLRMQAFRQLVGMQEGWSSSMKEVIHQPRYLLLATHKLYQLALCLRQMQATDHGDVELDLEGSPLEMADRFVTAADHVTSQDFLAKSVQGMELMMAQAYCRIYLGDPASMRPIFHRALTYGHILEIDKAVDEGNESMWFRLVYAERFLALGLGRQPFPMDDGFASDRLLATSNVTKRLERIHVLIAGRIIDRNLRIEQRRSDSAGNHAEVEYRQTQDIDHQLKQAARCAPID